jgi:hypothetical protein
MYDPKEVLEMCEKETPGPWEWKENAWNGGYSGIIGKDDVEVLFPSHRNDGDDGAAWFDKSWEFCNQIDCYALNFDKDIRIQAICSHCRAYKLHQYLKSYGRILEEGSEFAEKILKAKKIININLKRRQIEQTIYNNRPAGAHGMVAEEMLLIRQYGQLGDKLNNALAEWEE